MKPKIAGDERPKTPVKGNMEDFNFESDEEAKSRSGGSPSTPDHQKLIENEKIRDSMKARIADENEGYQQGHPAMRGSITDINKTMRESYKEQKGRNSR